MTAEQEPIKESIKKNSEPHKSCKDCGKVKMLQNLNKELKSILDYSYDGIVISNKEGVIERVNKAYERIIGYPKEKMLGKSGSDLLKDGIIFESVTAQVIESKSPRVIEQVYQNGRRAIIIGNPILDDEGNIYKIVHNIRDITELNNLKMKFNESVQLTKKYQVELEKLRTLFSNDEIIGVSQSLRQVYSQCLSVAKVNSTVLLLGESGVGKGVFAKKIHAESSRKNGPFIKINCGAIPNSLMETEIFGYEAGSFSGASKEGKAGVFEAANNGTLFLDEIGDLPYDLQVKLLQVIQDQEFRRVGGTKTIKVNVRIIAATNRDLTQMVARGTFRQDLFYRLSIIPITIPPLRERREDIPLLSYYFLDLYTKKYNVEKELSKEVVDCFIDYSWPGNVRQLENLVERLVVTNTGKLIMPEHLPGEFFNHHDSSSIQVKGLIPLDVALEEVERQLVTRAFEICGTTYKVAEMLGISQPTASRKINKYVLKREKEVR